MAEPRRFAVRDPSQQDQQQAELLLEHLEAAGRDGAKAAGEAIFHVLLVPAIEAGVLTVYWNRVARHLFGGPHLRFRDAYALRVCVATAGSAWGGGLAAAVSRQNAIREATARLTHGKEAVRLGRQLRKTQAVALALGAEKGP